MQQAMHAARLVAAHDALMALLVEASGDGGPTVDGVSATFGYVEGIPTLDVTYTAGGLPVSGEGL